MCDCAHLRLTKESLTFEYLMILFLYYVSIGRYNNISGHVSLRPVYLLYIFIPHFFTQGISILCGSYQLSVFFVLFSLTLLDRLVFWLHNLLCFAFVDIYHGLVVPLRFSFH